MEFFDVDKISWKPLKPTAGYEGVSGVYEKILSIDEETGFYTRLIKYEPGLDTNETFQHEFWEEVYIPKGGLIDKHLNQTFTEGMYACRPPGMKHGPYSAPLGCVSLEIRYYDGRTKR